MAVKDEIIRGHILAIAQFTNGGGRAQLDVATEGTHTLHAGAPRALKGELIGEKDEAMGPGCLGTDQIEGRGTAVEPKFHVGAGD